MVKHVWKRYKNQSRTFSRVNSKCRTCRENNQSCHKGYHCIQYRYVNGFAHQRTIFSNIASENRQCTNTQTQSKECLTHCSKDYFTKSRFHHLSKIRFEVKCKSFCCSVQQTGTNCQYCHNQKQTGHHELINTLHALLQSHGANAKAKYNNKDHPKDHWTWLRKHSIEGIANSLSIQTFKLSADHLDKVRKHPSANGGVKHHQKVVSQHSHITVDMPVTSLWLQNLKGAGTAFLAGTSNCKFHCHNRKAHDNQEKQINKYKSCSAVFSGNVRESPHISQANCTACGNQQKSQAG